MKQYEHLVWTPEMVKNFWDYTLRSPEEYFTYKHGAEVVRQIAPHLKKGNKVLDFGCGPGYLLDKLLAAGFHAAGLDTSVDTLQTVRERFNGRHGFQGAFDQTRLLESDLRFDAITIIEVIEHLYDEQLEGLFHLIRKLLNPDGQVVLTTPNEENLEDFYILCPTTNQLFHRWQHVRSWSASSLVEYLEHQGFVVVSCFTTNFSISLHPEHSKHPVKDRLRAVKRIVKHAIKPSRKQPHLVAIAQPK